MIATIFASLQKCVTPNEAFAALRRQLLQQRLGVLQIERVEAFGEPAVDRSEQLARLLHFALVTPEGRELEARPVTLCSITISVFDLLDEKS
jgi:hypothetical protein